MEVLNKLAHGSISSERKSQILKDIKSFGEGLKIPYHLTYEAAHDSVVSEENTLLSGERPMPIGFLVGMISYSALSIGAFEGVKYLYRKVKGTK